ncbi:MAG: hypothetical protein AB7F74_03170 [Parvibaculaceae bacterium]
MDTNPQYRPKTDPKVEPDIKYETGKYDAGVRSGTSSTGWIIGGLIVLALIAAFFMWGGSSNAPAPTTGTTTEQPVTPTPTPTPTPPQGSSEQPATPPAAPAQPQGSSEQPAVPAPAQPEGGTTGQGTTNP